MPTTFDQYPIYPPDAPGVGEGLRRIIPAPPGETGHRVTPGGRPSSDFMDYPTWQRQQAALARYQREIDSGQPAPGTPSASWEAPWPAPGMVEPVLGPSAERVLSATERPAEAILADLITIANTRRAWELRGHNEAVTQLRTHAKNAGMNDRHLRKLYFFPRPIQGGSEGPVDEVAVLAELSGGVPSGQEPAFEGGRAETEAAQAAAVHAARYDMLDKALEARRASRIRRATCALGSLSIGLGATVMYYADALNNFFFRQ